jgi:hypothetical protein
MAGEDAGSSRRAQVVVAFEVEVVAVDLDAVGSASQ